jgi:hypothetical protein
VNPSPHHPGPARDAGRDQSSPRLALAWVLTAFVAVMWAWVLLWPVVEHAVLLADDVPLLFAYLDPPEAFHPWDSWVYRPIEGLSSHLIDPVTRASSAPVFFHLPALLALAGALWWVLGRLGVDRRLAFPVSALWMATSVGTTVSFWQPDTTGQTACAALGAWLLIVTWQAMERGRRGEGGWRWPALVSVVTIAGLFTRELFVGWAAAAAALAIGAHLAWRGCPSRTATARLVLPLLLLPAVFVVLRYTTGGMALVTEIEPAYSPRLGANVARNVVLGIASVTATGPTHAVLAPGFPRWQAGIAVVSILVTISLVALPWLRDPRHAPPLAAWALVAVLSAGGLLVALPLEKMSEHYGFGPNLGVAALVGASAAYVWRRGRGRGALTALLLAALVAGAVGTVSRATHFASSWQQASALNTAVLNALERHEGDVVLSLPAYTAEGPRYNVYILPPAELYSVGQSEHFLDRADPTRRIHIEVGSTDPNAIPVNVR